MQQIRANEHIARLLEYPPKGWMAAKNPAGDQVHFWEKDTGLLVQIDFLIPVIMVTKYFGNEKEISKNVDSLEEAARAAKDLMEKSDSDIDEAVGFPMSDDDIPDLDSGGFVHGFPQGHIPNPIPVVNAQERRDIYGSDGVLPTSITMNVEYISDVDIPLDERVRTMQHFLLPAKMQAVRSEQYDPDRIPIFIKYNDHHIVVDGNHRTENNMRNNVGTQRVRLFDLDRQIKEKGGAMEDQNLVYVEFHEPMTNRWGRRAIKFPPHLYKVLEDKVSDFDFRVDPFGLTFGEHQVPIIDVINSGYGKPFYLTTGSWIFDLVRPSIDPKFNKGAKIRIQILDRDWDTQKQRMAFQKKKQTEFIKAVIDHQVEAGRLDRETADTLSLHYPLDHTYSLKIGADGYPYIDLGLHNIAFNSEEKIKLPYKKRMVSSPATAKMFLQEFAGLMGWTSGISRRVSEKIDTPKMDRGGVVEGKLHSECDEDGCGETFVVNETGQLVEVERDEPVLTDDAMKDNNVYTVEGTPSQIASALNVIGGGVSWETGAKVFTSDGKPMTGSKFKDGVLSHEDKSTDVVELDPQNVVINRQSFYSNQKYRCTGTPRQIASLINEVGGGVHIESGGSIEKI